MEFDTIEEAWKYWQSYGRKMGFGVRKHYINKAKDGVVTSRGFVCNKEGSRGKDKRDHLIKKGRAETRTDCYARMGIKLIREVNKYRIFDFVADHNHELHKPEVVHMMRSHRRIEDIQAFEVGLADDAGITQKKSHDFFGIQAGGRENLGFLRLDQKNYLRTKRQRELIYGEVGCLMGYFQNQALQDPSFVHAVQLDNEELITNIFWVDARMRIDYDLFGEVVTFDTTFATNKEYRPLGVFVGFNHHRELVFFGAALLYDETADSFVWLFEKFLEAHNFKTPITIFTDQDAAMAKALNKVMPETRHGLCSFHLMQNCIRHLGNLMKDGSHFLTDFKKLMYEYQEESEFEGEWNRLLEFYKVHGNDWLNNTYKLKEKWAKCYMKTTVTLGMRSTQLSESVNSDLKDYLKSNTDISTFFKHFERVVGDKRYKEKEADYNAAEKLPRIKVKLLPLLQQAGKVYTPCIFEMFQHEWEKSLVNFVIEEKENGEFHEYLVGSHTPKEKEYLVRGNKYAQTVSCGCRLFETFGILCSHSLKILDIMIIRTIPDLYIVKRWTKYAREGSMKTTERCVNSENDQLEQIDRYRDLCPEAVKLASFASETPEGYVIMKKSIREAYKQIVEVRKNCGYVGVDNSFEHLPNSSTLRSGVMNQPTIDLLGAKGLKKKDKVKGGRRRKSWVEMQGKKKRKQCKNVIVEENNNENHIANVPIQQANQKVYTFMSESSLF